MPEIPIDQDGYNARSNLLDVIESTTFSNIINLGAILAALISLE
jgi:hypothetical protein